jgi:hypothetical protein
VVQAMGISFEQGAGLSSSSQSSLEYLKFAPIQYCSEIEILNLQMLSYNCY